MQSTTFSNEELFQYLKSYKTFEVVQSNRNQLPNDELSIIYDSTKYLLNQYSTLDNNHTSTIIHVTNSKQYGRLRELLGLTTDTEEYTSHILEEEYAQISLLFPNVNSILIPKKAEYNLKKYVPKKLLHDIHPNDDKAIEKCLVMLSNLSSTYYTDSKWKSLNATILHHQLKEPNNNTYTYKKVVETLKAGTKKNGPIVEVMKGDEGYESYKVGSKSKQYKLGDTYLKAGLTEYILHDESIIQNRNKAFYKALVKANDNVITNNLINVYQHVEIPSIDEVLIEGKRLVKSGYTKKGKKLTMRNRHKNDYWKDWRNRSFVEDNIELFKFLTSRGFMIPVVGKETCGGRVTDSFNLMPSWIRNMVKINGEAIVECDYSAMHPNLAVNIYGGPGKHISHQEVADYLGIEEKAAKIEHLSFFNKPYYPTKGLADKGSMIHSPIHKYYEENEKLMLELIRMDKHENAYKVTTKKLFQLEVEIMTEVIKRLNEKGIYVLYVYDALYCTESDYEVVKSMMNEVACKMSVNTKV